MIKNPVKIIKLPEIEHKTISEKPEKQDTLAQVAYNEVMIRGYGLESIIQSQFIQRQIPDVRYSKQYAIVIIDKPINETP